jgi:ABC-type multidrug transport system fused ATPase/permease subunit
VGTNLGKTLAYFKERRTGIAGLGVISFFSAQFQAAALVLVVPLAKTIADGKSSFDGTFGPVTFSATTGRLALLAAAAVVLAGVLDVWLVWGRARMMADWDFRYREQVVAEYLDADYPAQAAERLGTLAVTTSYATRASGGLGAIISGIDAAVTILVFAIGAFLLDYRAALLLIFTIGILSLALRPIMTRTRLYSRELSHIQVDYNRDITETTRMVRDVRVFDAVEPLEHQMTALSGKMSKYRERALFVNSLTSPLYQALGLLLVVCALGLTELLPSIDMAVFGAIALLILRSLSFGQQFQNSYQTLVESGPFIDKLEEMRDMYRSHVSVDGTVTLEAVHDLVLKDVVYSYDGEVRALHGVSARFSPGEIVGIVGPSGSGKSTLSQLILRLREPDAGELSINGMSATDYTRSSWYRHVSLVPQDPRLLHATVAENIAFLDPSMTREQVVDAARAAGVNEVIEALEDGYDTLVGPAFHDLSGGQIQRVGIARAFARGAQVLVLDEPTSALDVHSEQVIQETLEGLRGKALVLIIAHRLSTLSICDRILVLREGKVETMGTLSEVSEYSDFFKRALEAGTLEIGIGGTGGASRVVEPDDR